MSLCVCKSRSLRLISIKYPTHTFVHCSRKRSPVHLSTLDQSSAIWQMVTIVGLTAQSIIDIHLASRFLSHSVVLYVLLSQPARHVVAKEWIQLPTAIQHINGDTETKWGSGQKSRVRIETKSCLITFCYRTWHPTCRFQAHNFPQNSHAHPDSNPQITQNLANTMAFPLAEKFNLTSVDTFCGNMFVVCDSPVEGVGNCTSSANPFLGSGPALLGNLQS